MRNYFITMLFTYCATVSLSSQASADDLFKAILIGGENKAAKLIKGGAAVEPQCDTPEICSPLLAAIESSQPKIMKLLIQHGVKLDVSTAMGLSALDMALKRYYDADEDEYKLRARKVVRRMVKGGVDVNHLNDYGLSGFAQAAAQGDVEMVELMLQHGAKIDATGKGASNLFGATPLMLAVEKGHERMVTLLLQKGANKTAKDSLGKNALDYATKNGHANIMALLK